MRAYAAFVKKEFLEMSRTYKLLIMGIIFGVLGLMPQAVNLARTTVFLESPFVSRFMSVPLDISFPRIPPKSTAATISPI